MWRMDVQRQRYGPHLYVKDEEGFYACFFKGCGQKYKANFSRHIEGHENKHDAVDDEFIEQQLAKYKDHPELGGSTKPRFRMSKRKVTVPLARCRKILENIKSRPAALPFLEPVDPIKHGAHDYYQVIESPMDLRTATEKLAASIADPTNGPYKSADDFTNDIKLIWGNARKYNAPGSPLYATAGDLARIFESKMEAARIATQHQQTDAAYASKFPGIELSPSQMLAAFETVQADPNVWPFIEPVDPDRYELPDYLRIIKEPMDLTTVWNNMQSGKYSRSYTSFARDMRLIFRNAMVYNEPGCDMYDYAEHLSAVFEAEIENALHSNSKQANSLETLFCLRDSTSKRVLFYDMEKGQYYLEYFETEDEQTLAELDRKEATGPPPKRRRMGDNPDPAVMTELAKFERNNSRKDPNILARINELIWACYRPRQSNLRTVGGERRRRAAAVAGMRNMNTNDLDESPAPASSRRKRARPTPAKANASEPGTPFDAPATPMTPKDTQYQYPASGVQTPSTGIASGGGADVSRPMTPFTPHSGYDEEAEDEYISISPRPEQSASSTPAPYSEPTPLHTPSSQQVQTPLSVQSADSQPLPVQPRSPQSSAQPIKLLSQPLQVQSTETTSHMPPPSPQPIAQPQQQQTVVQQPQESQYTPMDEDDPFANPEQTADAMDVVETAPQPTAVAAPETARVPIKFTLSLNKKPTPAAPASNLDFS